MGLRGAIDLLPEDNTLIQEVNAAPDRLGVTSGQFRWLARIVSGPMKWNTPRTCRDFSGSIRSLPHRAMIPWMWGDHDITSCSAGHAEHDGLNRDLRRACRA
jgi:hypothetical protein